MGNRVLLIEDDSNLAESVVQFLELNNFECDHCIDGREGLQLMQSNTYDVVVTDINMPSMTGYELCSTIRGRGIDTPILMISALTELDDKLKGFAEGTDDYLVKPFELKELLARVTSLSRRKSGQTKLISIEDLEVDLGRHSVTRAGNAIDLTPSAWKLLVTLARAYPDAVNRKDLEHCLWGDETPDSNALKVHIHNLRTKIDKPYDVKLLHSVSGFGFVLRPERA